jgi:hypothetical protein
MAMEAGPRLIKAPQKGTNVDWSFWIPGLGVLLTVVVLVGVIVMAHKSGYGSRP